MKKKIFALMVCIAMLAVAVVGGTLAYFTDEDEIANTMTLGNVAIEQHEYERDANGALVPFTQDKMLVPIVGENEMEEVCDYTDQICTNENVQDKFVRVENTGNVDAYIRTLIAIECNEGNEEPNFGTNKVGVKHASLGANLVTINSATYYIHEVVYLDKVAPKEFTPMSLEQIWLSSKATNETAKALDVNGNGALDVLVLSQAVQADGFDDAQTALDTAFGDLTAANAVEWFKNIAP